MKDKYRIEPVDSDNPEKIHDWYVVQIKTRRMSGPFDYGTDAADYIYKHKGKIIGRFLPYGKGTRIHT